MQTNLIYHGDCFAVLKRHFSEGNNTEGADLVYLDPPFSFDKKYARLWYDKETLEMFDELRKGGIKHYLAWLAKRLEQCKRVLKENGSIYLQCDWKLGFDIKLLMDEIFEGNFQNDIIWHYGLGGSSPKRWARKHGMILFYTKSKRWYFKPPMVPAKSQRMKGQFKKMDDVWDIPAINNMAKERTGYSTQKPVTLLERIISASSEEGGLVLDPMCGCGTTIAAAQSLNRRWVGIDISSQACNEMKKRMREGFGLDVKIEGAPLTIRELKSIGPFEFQDYICDMVNAQKASSKSGDKGIDGMYSKDEPEIPLQIKQQEGVGRSVVDEFETAVRRKGKTQGCIIGFSFTKGKRGAYEEVARAKNEEGLDIRLVSVEDLVRNDYELGRLLTVES
jgi:DNA modification methylase